MSKRPTQPESKCWGNDEILCPYCGHEQSDAWEYNLEDESIKSIECGECETLFAVHCRVRVYYDTAPVGGWDAAQYLPKEGPSDE